ncbi:MAG TPA: aminotransferase class III-fold pyridoxal phosphate-dependent enzyme, partial [Polyangiaceae bacterium]|nr:aminotransferase class III-fold pyridoxal phosphate-dependent enzyme [Polyangiaceae bacterium]
MSDKKPTNADVTAKFKRYLFPSNATYYAEPVAIESGKGSYVHDFDGHRYLDFFGGILTVGVGHANDRVNAVVRAQVDRLGHVSTMYPTLPVADLAEKLVKLAPGKLEKVFFCASGTEADETAVALAQAHTGRQEIVALRHGYSGRTMLAQSLTAHAKFRVVTTQAAAVKHAHAPYCYRCPFSLTYPSCEIKCAQDIEDLIQTTTTGQIAGAIFEPILGVGGFITPPAGWMKLAVDIVKKYGGIFICDEVQTGFGRTGGKMWAIEHEGVAPDVMTTAKGIANGFPISAVLATSAIADAWKGGNISTFGGNTVSCAAANAT